MRTPAIKLEKLVPLLDETWESCGYTAPRPALCAWACSGYYRDSMGKPGVNDRGINDDAIGVVSDRVDYRMAANVDPSVYREGVATLRPRQVIWYRPGWHGYASVYGHPAFRQDSPAIVLRDGTQAHKAGTIHRTYGLCLGNGYWTDARRGEDRFWTNLHRQRPGTTSSLGCLTVPDPPWRSFRSVVMAELARLEMERFPLILLQGPIN